MKIPAILTGMAICIGLGLTSASASPVLSGTLCQTSSVEGATACEGIFSGNDSNTNLDGLFGVNGWTEVLKLEVEEGWGSATLDEGGIELSLTNSGSGGGTWAIDGYGGFDPVMFVTKGGRSFSAFLMDLTMLSGDWDTNSMLTGGGSIGAGLSHWTIYQAGTAPAGPGPGPNPIPLPAAAWLLLGGIGGLLGLRRLRV